jgi:hypothetical protein
VADVRAVTDLQHGRVPNGVVNREVLNDPRFRARLSKFREKFAALAQ